MNRIRRLAEIGQAVWLDTIRRSLITSGDLKVLIDEGLTGVTSNPTIFEKAIAGSVDYNESLRRLVDEGRTANEIYEALVVDDIRRAADLLRPVYDQTDRADGYVSLEVDPALAYDTAGTISEARRLAAELGRPNVMIKVPATPPGIPAIALLISEAINVNATLIFSLAQYEDVAQAYVSGLERLMAAGGDVRRVSSVASFFVSRVDVAVDRALEAMGEGELQGRIAVANCKVAYARFREILSGARWDRLARRGARVQRVLWASTSTKNLLYPDTLYVDRLIGPDTVNTLPPATLDAFRDHGSVAVTLAAGLGEAQADLGRLADLGVDLDTITQELLDEGVAKFARSFDGLLSAIAQKRKRLLSGWMRPAPSLGARQSIVDGALADMDADQILPRIWRHDYTVWKPDPAEITNRLGWLHIAEAMKEQVPRLEALAAEARDAGYTQALLLGMGGSSLAPDVFRHTFGVRHGYLDLAVLDSTDPAAVLSQSQRLDLARTIFIVSTKSGGTTETLSLFKTFYNQVLDALGQDEAGQHFIAITDPGSTLADLARRCRFRAIFLNDPDIGGRYSALSYFGLVPAALLGMDVHLLLGRALGRACDCGPSVPLEDNPCAQLGAILGELAQAGRDKVTFVMPPGLASFGDWVEQLIAESTGKESKGILPVVHEPLGPPQVYGDDRLFVHIRLSDDDTHDAPLAALEDAGHPLVRLTLYDAYDLGGQFFLWELAVAVAGHRLGINPFDQPNVEAAKAQARRMIRAYAERGALPLDDTSPLTVEALTGFLAQAQPGDYIALQAYLQPTADTTAALARLREALRDRYRLATTVGYGPRFLHSTGQLHKGDAGNGLFIQFTANDARDVAIPDEPGSSASSISFGVLKAAQAMGDHQALLDAGRRVVRFHLGDDVLSALAQLQGSLT